MNGYTAPPLAEVYRIESLACDLALTLGLIESLPWWSFIERGGLRLKAHALADSIREALLRTEFTRRAPTAGAELAARFIHRDDASRL